MYNLNIPTIYSFTSNSRYHCRRDKNSKVQLDRILHRGNLPIMAFDDNYEMTLLTQVEVIEFFYGKSNIPVNSKSKKDVYLEVSTIRLSGDELYEAIRSILIKLGCPPKRIDPSLFVTVFANSIYDIHPNKLPFGGLEKFYPKYYVGDYLTVKLESDKDFPIEYRISNVLYLGLYT